MIHYRDMTFCASHGCKNKCGRKLTDEVRDGAKKLHMPLSLGDFCGEDGEPRKQEREEK